MPLVKNVNKPILNLQNLLKDQTQNIAPEQILVLLLKESLSKKDVRFSWSRPSEFSKAISPLLIPDQFTIASLDAALTKFSQANVAIDESFKTALSVFFFYCYPLVEKQLSSLSKDSFIRANCLSFGMISAEMLDEQISNMLINEKTDTRAQLDALIQLQNIPVSQLALVLKHSTQITANIDNIYKLQHEREETLKLILMLFSKIAKQISEKEFIVNDKKDRDLLQNSFAELLGKIFKKSGEITGFAFDAVPSFLEGIKQLLVTKSYYANTLLSQESQLKKLLQQFNQYSIWSQEVTFILKELERLENKQDIPLVDIVDKSLHQHSSQQEMQVHITNLAAQLIAGHIQPEEALKVFEDSFGLKPHIKPKLYKELSSELNNPEVKNPVFVLLFNYAHADKAVRERLSGHQVKVIFALVLMNLNSFIERDKLDQGTRFDDIVDLLAKNAKDDLTLIARAFLNVQPKIPFKNFSSLIKEVYGMTNFASYESSDISTIAKLLAIYLNLTAKTNNNVLEVFLELVKTEKDYFPGNICTLLNYLELDTQKQLLPKLLEMANDIVSQPRRFSLNRDMEYGLKLCTLCLKLLRETGQFHQHATLQLAVEKRYIEGDRMFLPVVQEAQDGLVQIYQRMEKGESLALVVDITNCNNNDTNTKRNVP